MTRKRNVSWTAARSQWLVVSGQSDRFAVSVVSCRICQWSVVRGPLSDLSVVGFVRCPPSMARCPLSVVQIQSRKPMAAGAASVVSCPLSVDRCRGVGCPLAAEQYEASAADFEPIQDSARLRGTKVVKVAQDRIDKIYSSRPDLATSCHEEQRTPSKRRTPG
jgi:hypothetical protein